MSRTLTDKTLRTLAIALACTGCATSAALTSGEALASTGASAGTGGADAPARTDPPSGAGATAAGTPAGRNAPYSHRHGVNAHHEGEQIATWFGPGFYGQKTACGQTMTPAIVGVASRTLPCGTLVLVNYKGRQLTVPVIDRGPYAHNGATWDLTWGAASALSIEDTVRVKTKVVGHATNTPLLGVPEEAQPIAGASAAPAG